MVTTTPTRTPHALQSGPRTGFLWVLQFLILITLQSSILLLLPEAGRRFGWKAGVLTPDATLMLGAVITLAVFIAALAVLWAINRSLDMRIPGRLLNDGPPAVIAPALLAIIAGNIIIGLAAFYAATHSAGDYGLTKVMLAAIGLAALASTPGRLLFAWGRGAPGRTARMIVTGTDFVLGGAILLAASVPASGGVLYSALSSSGPVFFIVIVTLLSLIIGAVPIMARKDKDRRVREEPSKDPLRTFSDRLVDAQVASPTLRHYHAAYRLTVTALVIVVVLCAVTAIGWTSL